MRGDQAGGCEEVRVDEIGPERSGGSAGPPGELDVAALAAGLTIDDGPLDLVAPVAQCLLEPARTRMDGPGPEHICETWEGFAKAQALPARDLQQSETHLVVVPSPHRTYRGVCGIPCPP